MKIEIKNVKHSAFASQETHCFQATVYVDGKKAFIASNNGHGGCDEYFPLKGMSGSDMWTRIHEINAELNKEEIKTPHGTLKNDLELVVSDLVNKWLREREVMKIMKKVAYVGKDGAVYTLPAKVKPTPKNLELVKKAKWWKPEYKLLNTMPIEKAMEHL